MKKINILKKNYDYNRIIKNTKPIKYKDYIIYIERTNEDIYHFGFSISKKIGKAVIRNKIKRRIKNIINKKDYQNGFNCIIMVRKTILNKTFLEMKIDLFNIFDKLNIIEGEKS